MPAVLQVQIVGDDKSQAAFASLQRNLADIPSAAGEAAQSLGGIPAAAAAAGSGFDTATQAAGTYIDANGRLRDANGRFLPSAKAAGDAARAFGDEASGAGAKLSAFGEVSTGALRHIGEIGVDALGQAAGAAVGFVKDSLDAAGTFEAKMNTLGAVLGDSLGEAGFTMEDVSAKALELGANTQFSAAQAQEAMIALAKGGVPVVDIMGAATDASLNLAAAGGIELAQAADIVAKQLGVWAETGVTATQAADMLAQAANASTVDVDELALGMANVGGTAKAAGVDFGELTQTMALIAPNFASAADAGTSLKTFIANLQPDTKPAIEAMRDLGLYTEETGSVFYDAQGNFVGMEQAAALLHDATAGLSEAQRVQALNTIFGSDAIRAAGAIAIAGADGFNQMGEAMGMAGSAADQAAKMNTGYKASMDAMKGSIETVQIVIGSALLPVLTQLINQVLTPAINSVLAFASGITSARDPLAALTAQISAVVPGFSTFMSYAQQVWTALQPLVGLIQANLVPILVSLAGIAGGALIVALGGLVASFLSLAAPIIALVGLGAVLYNAWTSNFGGIRDVVTAVLGAVWSVVSAVVSQITSFWQSNGAQILAGASQTWNQLYSVVSGAIQLIGAIITTVLAGIVIAIEKHGDTIQMVLGGAWNILHGVVTAALSLLQGVIEAGLAIIQGDWEGAWTAIQEGAAGFVAGVVEVISGAVELLGAAALEGVNAIVGQWESLDWGGVGGSVISGIVQGIKNGIGSVIDAARSMAQAALSAAMGALDSHSPSREFAKVGETIPQGIALGIESASPEAIDALLDLSERLVTLITDGTAAMGQLDSFVAPSAAAVGRFGDALALVVGMINVVATWFANEAIGAATEFAESASTMLATIEDGAAVFGLIETAVAPSREAVGRFGDSLALVVGVINVVAGWFRNEATALAANFAESAQKMLGIVGPAIDAFARLPELVPPANASIAALRTGLINVMGAFIDAALYWDAKAVEAAAIFSEGAGKAFSIIGTTVDNLVKLPDLVAPSNTAIATLRLSLINTISVFIDAALYWDAKAVEAAGIFSEGAGKAFGIIGTTVDGLARLPDLVVPANAAIANLRLSLINVISAFIDAASYWNVNAVAAAAVFSEGAGKAIATIGTTVDNLSRLADLKPIGEKAMIVFADMVGAMLRLLETVSASFSAEAVSALAGFGEGAGKALAFIGSTIDSLGKLADLKVVGEKAMIVFADMVASMLRSLQTTAASFSTEAIAALGTFGEQVQKAVGFISGAIDSFAKLEDLKGNLGKGVLTQFADTLKAILAELLAQVLPASEDIGTQIVAGIARGLEQGKAVLVKAVEDVLDATIAAAISDLGIASPSTVWDETIGRQMSAGMARGVLSGGGQVVGAVREVTGAATTVAQHTTTNTYHSYQITGYNAEQAGDLTATIRQLQLLQDAA